MPSRLPDTLETPRLLLRPLRREDAVGIFRSYAQDPQVCRYTVWTPHADVRESEAFVAACMDAARDASRTPYVLALRERPDVPVGMLEARWWAETLDIGYVLARPHWGQGLMPEAVAAVAEIALGLPWVYRIQATCDVENTGSRRVLEKAGFTQEARLERHMVHPNISAEPRPCFLYVRS